MTEGIFIVVLYVCQLWGLHVFRKRHCFTFITLSNSRPGSRAGSRVCLRPALAKFHYVIHIADLVADLVSDLSQTGSSANLVADRLRPYSTTLCCSLAGRRPVRDQTPLRSPACDQLVSWSQTCSRASRKLDSVMEFSRKLVCDLLASWTV